MKISVTHGLILGLLLLTGTVAMTAPGADVVNLSTDGSQQYFEVGDMRISVPSSEVPFYFYWNVNDNTSVYKIHFDTMFEANDLDNNSQYDQDFDTLVPQSVTPLAQMDWAMSEVTEISGGIAFNLTGTLDQGNPNVASALLVQFRNYLVEDNGTTSLKFDVVVRNYQWKSSEALLVLGFKLDVTDPNYGNGPQRKNGPVATRTQFGNGYMESLSSANVSDGISQHQIQSRLTVGNNTSFSDDRPRLFLSYEHFDGDLIHDPTLGIDQSEENTIVAGDLSLKVPTSQVPFYFFWQTDQVDPTYRVAFNSIFEVVDANENGLFDTDEHLVPQSLRPLSTWDWRTSSIVEDTVGDVTTYSFDMTGVAGKGTAGDTIFQFSNHIVVDGNSTILKFDVGISNFEWTDNTSNVLLVLGYRLTTTNEQYSGTPEFNGTQAVFGDAYMHTVNTAFSNNGTETQQVNASMSIGDSNLTGDTDSDARVFIAYTHFDGNMTHDPSLGLLSVDEGTVSTPIESTTSQDTPQDTVGSLGSTNTTSAMVLGTSAFVIIPVVYRRIRSKSQ